MSSAEQSKRCSPLLCFVDVFVGALQADENYEAVYGWMAEECESGDGESPKPLR